MNILKLKCLIERSNKTINQIQNEAEMASGSLYKLLNGSSNDIELKRAFKLADALGVDINEFREEQNESGQSTNVQKATPQIQKAHVRRLGTR